jgi:hypothetical protein
MHSAPRLTLLVSCLVAGLTAAAAQAGHIDRGIPPFVRRAAAPPRIVLKESFVGFGPRAEDLALEKARDWLVENARLDWTPDPEYLRRRGLVHPIEPTAEDKASAHKVGDEEPVRLELAVTRDQAEDLYKVAREQRMVPRHLLVARILAAVLAVVLVAGGYLRLEEATRGYYTLLLRAAAVAVLVVVGAGLYLTV